MATLKELRDVRINKLNKLRKLGINPFPSKSKKDYPNSEIIDNFDKYEGKEVTLAGRMMSWREHGALAFADLQDFSGTIQIYIHRDDLGETNKDKQTLGFEDLNLLDVGDFVQITGNITKTKRGEKSIQPSEIKILVKAIRPLPEKWEGLKDLEVKFRRRYLELATKPEVREMFVRKAKFWESARDFMLERGFIEVETPILEHVTGGGDAKPFKTHHNALDQDFYLRISSELYQKRLIGGGFEKIFVLGPNFRNEGIDSEHLQEYYQLEYYWAYSDINDTIEFTKEMFEYLAKEVWGTTKFERSGMKFDLSKDWEVIDYPKVIKEKLGIDVFKDSEDKMKKVLMENKVSLSGDLNRNRIVDNLWKILRKDVAGPAALINSPKFISPLAKSNPEDENTTQRFQPIIAGSELGNAYSELNDPIEQFERFKEQQGLRDAGDDEAHMLDIDYVEMLEYGMPPTSSIGFSERVFWFLEGVTAREGTFFPQMRYKLDQTTKEIYDL